MKVIILAAGKGTRLGRKGVGPKPLTILANGLSILGMQLEVFAKTVGLSNVYIIVGYQKEMIMSLFNKVTYIDNPDYENENTAKSLLKGLEHVRQDEDVLWINGDVVFHPSVLEKLLEADKTAMVVNQGEVGDEEIKYRIESSGNLVEVSKEVVGAEGEALGINLFKAEAVPQLKQNLEICKPNDYFEKGVELAIQEGLAVGCVVVGQNDCVEVDFPEDIDKANLLLASW